jgi:hypothetical protein
MGGKRNWIPRILITTLEHIDDEVRFECTPINPDAWVPNLVTGNSNMLFGNTT